MLILSEDGNEEGGTGKIWKASTESATSSLKDTNEIVWNFLVCVETSSKRTTSE